MRIEARMQDVEEIREVQKERIFYVQMMMWICVIVFLSNLSEG